MFTLYDTGAGTILDEKWGKFAPGAGRPAYGKIKRRAGGLVALEEVASLVKAGLTQFWYRLREFTCCAPPSPRRIFPAPAAFPRECIFNDQQTGPVMVTSLPRPLAGE